jgi:hypothetical protein
MRPRSASVAVIAALALAATLPAGALASSSNGRPASRSERSAIVRSFAANDGSASSVRGVYVSRSNSNLAVVCERTPEGAAQAYVFGRSHGSWRYLTSGSPGRTGNSADRRLEHACG